MGRVRYLIADLYFTEKPDRLANPVFLKETIESAVLEWMGENGTIQMAEGPGQGWCGICSLTTGRVTFQTFPSWDYLTFEILSFERHPDSKMLQEMLVARFEPAVLSTDSIGRGYHLPLSPIL